MSLGPKHQEGMFSSGDEVPEDQLGGWSSGGSEASSVRLLGPGGQSDRSIHPDTDFLHEVEAATQPGTTAETQPTAELQPRAEHPAAYLTGTDDNRHQ